MTRETSLLGMSGHFMKGNVHSHSTNSDGTLSPEDLAAWYANHGYDFLAITDHDLQPHSREPRAYQPHGRARTHLTSASPLVLLTAGEFHPLATRHGERWHLTAAGLPTDFDASAYDDDPAGFVRAAAATGAWVCVAHPAGLGVSAEEILALGGVHAIEIHNERQRWWDDRIDSWYLIDELAARGHSFGAAAVDDAHFDDRPDHGRAWVMVDTSDRTSAGIVAALRARRFYASLGPDITRIYLSNGELHVDCSPAQMITAVGAGQLADTLIGHDLRHATFPIHPYTDGYVRVIVRDAAGNRAWSNTLHV